jgi:hypothetical protein
MVWNTPFSGGFGRTATSACHRCCANPINLLNHVACQTVLAMAIAAMPYRGVDDRFREVMCATRSDTLLRLWHRIHSGAKVTRNAWAKIAPRGPTIRGCRLSNHRRRIHRPEQRVVTSARKIAANRANARASTGPKTANSRARSARNALRHGLSRPIHSDPALSEEVEVLAREIAGPDAAAEIQELARRVAEAQIDLHRIRRARDRLLCNASNDPNAKTNVALPQELALILSQQTKKLLAMDRYERGALLPKTRDSRIRRNGMQWL